jgi:hypothetical protein
VRIEARQRQHFRRARGRHRVPVPDNGLARFVLCVVCHAYVGETWFARPFLPDIFF